MKIFDNPQSPYALKIRILLYEKGVDFDLHEIKREADRTPLIAVNPRGEVPALQDGDVVVADSRVMGEYIEERFPTPSTAPTDLGELARMRRLELFADTQLDAAMLALALFRLFRPDMIEAFPAALERAESDLRSLFRYLDGELGEREFFCGDLSRADIAILPHLALAGFVGCPPDDATPHLTAWTERMMARPSVQKAQAEALEAFTNEKDLEDPLFDTGRLHWRSDRIEQLLRIGLGPWLLEELATDRGFLPPILDR